MRLCACANGATGDGFLHPVVRAIVLHFMLSTARQDLQALVSLDLDEKRKRGKAFTFLPKVGLEERLRGPGGAT